MLARDPSIWPLNQYWFEMETSNFGDSWRRIMKYFDLLANPNARDHCFNKIQERIRDWRSEVKDNFWIKYKDDERKMMKMVEKESRIDIDQFLELKRKWESPENQDLASRNSENRKKKTANHRTGSKSYAQVAYRMIKNGRKPSTLDVARVSYESSSLVDQMDEMVNEALE